MVSLGLAHNKSSQNENCMELFTDSLALCERFENRDEKYARVLVNLGEAYFELEEIQKSVDIFERCLLISSLANDDDFQRTVYDHLIWNYIRLDNNKKAIEYFERIDELSNFTAGYNMLRMMSWTYDHLDKFEKVIETGTRVLELS